MISNPVFCLPRQFGDLHVFGQTTCFFMKALILTRSLVLIFQDGRIDYNEFVAMMQKGNSHELGKTGLQNSISFGFRHLLQVH